MSCLCFELQKELEPALRSGDTARCEREITDRLSTLPESPFHLAIPLRIHNPPEEIALHFDGFIREQTARLDVQAVYAEMNGFEINPDRWYYDVFAYEEYGGHQEYDWLANWQSAPYPAVTIRGLEPLQEVYATVGYQKSFSDAFYVAGLLVVVRFQDLIRRSVRLMTELRSPVLATAHDYDFIFEGRPSGRTSVR